MPSSNSLPLFSRRDFIKQGLSAAGVAYAAPSLWGQGAAQNPAEGYLPTSILPLLRTGDLLHIRLKGYKLRLGWKFGAYRCFKVVDRPKKGEWDGPPILVVEFPPQHMAEHFYWPEPSATDADIATKFPMPMPASLSGTSRLVFRFDGSDANRKAMAAAFIDQPMTIERFLAWLYTYSLWNEAADVPRTVGASFPQVPWNRTSLELSTGLYISPDRNHPQRWVTRVREPREPGTRELWHLTLAQGPLRPLIGANLSQASWAKSDAEEGEALRRLLLSPVPPKEDAPYGVLNIVGGSTTSLDKPTERTELPLRCRDRLTLIQQSSEEMNLGVLRGEHVSLTSRGVSAVLHYRVNIADLDLKPAAANPPGSLPCECPCEQALHQIMEWVQVTLLGRDQYVRVVTPGYLLPFQHRAVLVSIGERKPLQEKKGAPRVAGGLLRQFVLVLEPTRHFPSGTIDSTADCNDKIASAIGRGLGLRRVTIKTLQTPDLDKDWWDNSSNAQGLGYLLTNTKAERNRDRRVRFDLDVVDAAGQRRDYRMALYFVYKLEDARHYEREIDRETFDSVDGQGMSVVAPRPQSRISAATLEQFFRQHSAGTPLQGDLEKRREDYFREWVESLKRAAESATQKPTEQYQALVKELSKAWSNGQGDIRKRVAAMAEGYNRFIEAQGTSLEHLTRKLEDELRTRIKESSPVQELTDFADQLERLLKITQRRGPEWQLLQERILRLRDLKGASMTEQWRDDCAADLGNWLRTEFEEMGEVERLIEDLRHHYASFSESCTAIVSATEAADLPAAISAFQGLLQQRLDPAQWMGISNILRSPAKDALDAALGRAAQDDRVRMLKRRLSVVESAIERAGYLARSGITRLDQLKANFIAAVPAWGQLRQQATDWESDLAKWRKELEDCCASQADTAVRAAMRRVIPALHLPDETTDALIRLANTDPKSAREKLQKLLPSLAQSQFADFRRALLSVGEAEKQLKASLSDYLGIGERLGWYEAERQRLQRQVKREIEHLEALGARVTEQVRGEINGRINAAKEELKAATAQFTERLPAPVQQAITASLGGQFKPEELAKRMGAAVLGQLAGQLPLASAAELQATYNQFTGSLDLMRQQLPAYIAPFKAMRLDIKCAAPFLSGLPAIPARWQHAPAIAVAEVLVPQLAELGEATQNARQHIAMFEDYVRHGYDAIRGAPSEAFARFVKDMKADAEAKAHAVGEQVAAAMLPVQLQACGLSREIGLLMGDAAGAAAQTLLKTGDPKQAARAALAQANAMFRQELEALQADARKAAQAALHKVLGDLKLFNTLPLARLLNLKELLPSGLPKIVTTRTKEIIDTQLLWEFPLDNDIEVAGVAFLPNRGQTRLTIQQSLRFNVLKPGAPVTRTEIKLTPEFKLLLFKSIQLEFGNLVFRQEPDGSRTIDGPAFRNVKFCGSLSYVSALQSWLEGFFSGQPPVRMEGGMLLIGSRTNIGVVPLGPWTMMGVWLESSLGLPLNKGGQLTYKFSFCSEQEPFRVLLNGYQGLGYFNVAANPRDGVYLLQAGFGIGGSENFNIGGIARGGGTISAGVRITKDKASIKVSAQFLAYGHLRVLGFINFALSAILRLEYERGDNGSALSGLAHFSVSYSVGPFDYSVSFTYSRKLLGSGGKEPESEAFDPGEATIEPAYVVPPFDDGALCTPSPNTSPSATANPPAPAANPNPAAATPPVTKAALAARTAMELESRGNLAETVSENGLFRTKEDFIAYWEQFASTPQN